MRVGVVRKQCVRHNSTARMCVTLLVRVLCLYLFHATLTSLRIIASVRHDVVCRPPDFSFLFLSSLAHDSFWRQQLVQNQLVPKQEGEGGRGWEGKGLET